MPVSFIAVGFLVLLSRCVLVPSTVPGIKYEGEEVRKEGTKGRKRKERELSPHVGHHIVSVF